MNNELSLEKSAVAPYPTQSLRLLVKMQRGSKARPADEKKEPWILIATSFSMSLSLASGFPSN